MMNTVNLIIGAGISGLTFANFCKDNYIIVEKENTVGGYCRTIRKGEFIWDYAGHFFHFKNDELKQLFLSNMKRDEIIYNKKCTKILYKNKLIDFPFQKNIHQLNKSEFIDCLYDLFKRKEKSEYDNFLDMLYSKFGKSIVEKFLRPYNEKLYAIELDKLDVNSMGRFFPYADFNEIIENMKNSNDNSYNQEFLYPKNGAGSFINVLYEKVNKKNVLLNVKVDRIDLSNKTAFLSDGSIIKYQNIINTIPFNNFLKLIGNYDDIVNEMSYNKCLVLNLGFDKPSPRYKKEHWIYIPSKERNYYRIGFYNNILKSKNLSMYIEIGYSKNSNITKSEINRQLQLTIENLVQDGIISKNMKLLEYEAITMDPAYVHINTKTNKKLLHIMDELKKKNIYTIGRYGAWTYNSMEDSMLMARDLAKKLK